MKARFGVGALLAACLAWACTGAKSPTQPTPPHNPIAAPDAGHPDGGPPDAGRPDAGTPDSGQPDAGPPDAGTPDGGSDAGTQVTGYELPSIPGWQFYGVQNGGPVHVYGTAMDEGGNLWVAGGAEGLFLMTPDEQAKGSAAQFRRLTMADGLHPYGYMPDGGDAPGDHTLNVISVAGGPAGTVFVGYLGKGSTYGNDDACEQNWDQTPNDPSIYKSGDADRVELQADGTLHVVHYDIFSGPEMVCRDRNPDQTCVREPDNGEPAGRERLCSIYRIAYDKNHNSLWFGGNHGFAWGDPNFPGPFATHCFGPFQGLNAPSYGNYYCSGVLEHAHPAFSCEGGLTCTYRYYGLDVDPSGNLWVGGFDRSLVWNMGNRGANFWGYEGVQFQSGFPTEIDIWADPGGPQGTWPNQWNQDAVAGVAAMPDGSAYFASFTNGIAHIDLNGNIGYVGGELDPHLSAVARDPATGAVWFGGYGGLSILNGGAWSTYSVNYFGPNLTSGKIADIQAQEIGGARKVVVGFHHTDGDGPGYPADKGGPDAVGVFSGSGLP